MQLRGILKRKVGETHARERIFAEEVKRFRIEEANKILVLPEMKTIQDTDIIYPLIAPFSYVRIKWDEDLKSLIYSIEEPHITPEEKKIADEIEDGLARIVESNIDRLRTQGKSLIYIQGKVNELIDEYGLVFLPGQYTRIMYYVYINFVGLNRLEPIMHDSYIEDIGCDGVDSHLYVTHKKYGNLRTNVIYKKSKELQEFVVKLAERCGRYVSYAEPLLDGTLPDGSRVNATLAYDVTTKGPTFSIRKFRDVPYSAVDLIRMKTASSELMAYLWYIIEHRSNILVCGGTGAGKTSFLNSIVSFIPPEDKIVSIEDTRELNLVHENWIPAVARIGFGTMANDGTRYGEVTMFSLLKESFRQRPDYVVVGEVRGVEASVLFQGMASGHPSLGTIHGGSVDDILKRMETPPISLSPGLLESLDVVIVLTHASQYGKSARRVKEISEIVNVDTSTGKAHDVKSFHWSPAQDTHSMEHSHMLENISGEYAIPLGTIDKEIQERTNILNWLLKKKITSFSEVSSYIASYYKDKKALMKQIKGKGH